MKKMILAALILFGGTAIAQSTYGIKGGLNYGATGEYENFSQAAGDASSIEDGTNKTGYHLGIFGKLEFLGFFLQPELVYTNLNTEYNTFDYKIDKIDAPILLGVNLLGPLHIKAGPSFQYILNNKLEGTSFEIIEIDHEISMGYQLGAGVNLGRLGVDLRYEGAFKENNAFGEAAADNKFRIDSRPSQWILGVSYSLK